MFPFPYLHCPASIIGLFCKGFSWSKLRRLAVVQDPACVGLFPGAGGWALFLLSLLLLHFSFHWGCVLAGWTRTVIGFGVVLFWDSCGVGFVYLRGLYNLAELCRLLSHVSVSFAVYTRIWSWTGSVIWVFVSYFLHGDKYNYGHWSWGQSTIR